MDNLEHHIQFVRSLEIAMKGSSTVRRVKSSEDEKAEERLKAILVQCRELTRLKTDSVFEELFEVLANNRGTIVSFKLRSAPDLQYMPRLWHILGDDTDSHCMRNLSHLALTRVHLPGDGGDPVLHLAFVKLCRRLETLECYNCPMKDWAAPVSPIHNEDDPQQMPWALKRVRLMKVLDMMSVNTFFLKRCTSLEELFWSSCLHQDLDEDFLQFLAQSRLEFLSVDGLKLPDEFLTRLIEHLPPTIAKLRLNTQSQIVNMGPRFVAAAAAITSPSLSIISIIPSVSKLTSAPTQQLLSSCANIVRFDDSLSVDAVDLSTAPWVMSRLVALNLTIKDVASLRTVPSTHPGSGSSQSGGFDRMIYEQLSRLVSLEELVLTEITEETSWISFSLSHGMGVLAALAHLRRLDISGLQGLRMGATEGQWICGHWPALEYLVVRPGKESLSHLRMMSCLRKNHPELKFNKWTL
ncbi:hypothetical protein B0O80DRAFT_488444 [Mortierella sp. GBAus27b]|nr:hypothetical protein B0O80DRAFT_488444 [Mortierella sp. GBAus27b]